MSKKQPLPPIDDRLRGRANVTRDALVDLGKTCREYGVSERTKHVLARMASYPPPIRLSVNLKTLVGLMAASEKPKFTAMDVLNDGLLPDEYAALAELDMKGLPTASREIAHGLFNVHERWLLMRELRKVFRLSFAVKDEYISPKTEEIDGSNP